MGILNTSSERQDLSQMRNGDVLRVRLQRHVAEEEAATKAVQEGIYTGCMLLLYAVAVQRGDTVVQCAE